MKNRLVKQKLTLLVTKVMVTVVIVIVQHSREQEKTGHASTSTSTVQCAVGGTDLWFQDGTDFHTKEHICDQRSIMSTAQSIITAFIQTVKSSEFKTKFPGLEMSGRRP